jgi:hypothetical protein
MDAMSFAMVERLQIKKNAQKDQNLKAFAESGADADGLNARRWRFLSL